MEVVGKARKRKKNEAAGAGKEEGKLIEEEERATGAVSLRVYWTYARSATLPLTLGKHSILSLCPQILILCFSYCLCLV